MKFRANGNIMTTPEHEEYTGGKLKNRWVFDEQAAAKPTRN
jgi:hypothetical protein